MSSDGTLSTASWYRFDGAAGNRMSEYAPGYNQKCGTQTGGWLSTPHPSVGAGPTAGEVCWEHGSHECYWATKVEVCACSYDGGATLTYTYKLPRPASCDVPSAYCGTSSTTILSLIHI